MPKSIVISVPKIVVLWNQNDHKLLRERIFIDILKLIFSSKILNKRLNNSNQNGTADATWCQSFLVFQYSFVKTVQNVFQKSYC